MGHQSFGSKAFILFSLLGISNLASASGVRQFMFPLVKPKPTGIDLMADLRDYADVMRESNDFNGYLDDPALTAVTREFGQSVITIRQFPYRSGIVVADPKPWSSWWYPKKEDTLFTNVDSHTLAPLVKYDMLRKIRAELTGQTPPNSAADYEKASYNSNVLPWRGSAMPGLWPLFPGWNPRSLWLYELETLR